MKRTLIGLASIALLTLSSNAFAQASGESSDKATTAVGGPASTDTAKTKKETDPGAKVAPAATDTTGATGTPDASQAKRKDTSEPAQSGSK
jgi:hypothetical protein